jgi:type I restriction enzyme M protein
MIKRKGQANIGDDFNKIIGKFAKANDLDGVITVADFNDDEKMGQEKIDRLTNLILKIQLWISAKTGQNMTTC